MINQVGALCICTFLGHHCPRLIRCELSQLRCHGHSHLLSSYLCRIKWKNSSCSACGHPLQDATHLLLNCSASEPLRHTIFGTTSIFDLWSRPWGVNRLVVYVEFFHAIIPQTTSRSTTTSLLVCSMNFSFTLQGFQVY